MLDLSLDEETISVIIVLVKNGVDVDPELFLVHGVPGHLFGEDGRQVHFVLPVFFHLVVLGGEAKAHRCSINSTSNKLFHKDRFAFRQI